jgi:hypothetical protein
MVTGNTVQARENSPLLFKLHPCFIIVTGFVGAKFNPLKAE